MCAFPGVALGQGSGADEYTENIPGGGGNTPTNNNGNGSGGGSDGGGSPLPQGAQEALAQQGSDGAAAANLAAETGPNRNATSGKQGGGSGGDGAGGGLSGGEGSSLSTPTKSDSGGSGIGEVVGELAGGSDDGMGILLPIILGSVLVAAVAFVLIRRTGGPAGPA